VKVTQYTHKPVVRHHHDGHHHDHHDHNCYHGHCNIPEHHHEPKKPHNHEPDNHKHEHNHSAWENLKDNFRPSNLITLSGMMLASYGFGKLVNQVFYTDEEKKHHDNANEKHSWQEIVKSAFIYALEIGVSMMSWHLIAGFIPKMNWKFQIDKKHPSLFQQNNKKIGKTITSTFKNLNYKHLAALIGLFTGIQGLTEGIKNNIETPFNKSLVDIAALALKLFSVYKLDKIFMQKDSDFAGFIQSFFRTCECCGNPQLFCAQMMPVYWDLGKKGINGLTGTN